MSAVLLGPSDYRHMPWANGRGTTVEMYRQDAPDGTMLWRLSVAAVVEDGAFSRFPGIERNLTVIDGPGFDLVGPGQDLRADPLVPVSFPGDIDIAARNVAAEAKDFNVMVARALGQAEVHVLHPGHSTTCRGATCAVFALGETVVDLDGAEVAMQRHGLWLGVLRGDVANRGQHPVIAVTIPGKT